MLVFAVTRVIFIPQGEFVAYGALTLAVLQIGKRAGHGLAAARAGGRRGAARVVDAVRRGLPGGGMRARGRVMDADRARRSSSRSPSWPAPQKLPLLVQSRCSTLAIVTRSGPLVYRLAYQPLADATVLVLLIVSVGVHFALTGLGLVFFGAEGSRNAAFSDERFTVGALALSGQTLWIFGVSIALIVALCLFFGRTLLRQGAARDRGQPARRAPDGHLDRSCAGELTFGLAALHRRVLGRADRADRRRSTTTRAS